MKVTIVIDVFRAFSTAPYVLEQKPRTYVIAKKSDVLARLAQEAIDPIFIGKYERGVSHFAQGGKIGFIYNFSNSPTHVRKTHLVGKTVFHRTEAGPKGILESTQADVVLAAGFTNAAATVKYIQSLKAPICTFLAMGHEGNTPSLEDDLCAKYLQNLMQGIKMDLDPYFNDLRQGPGKYFFGDDQEQYPSEDFDHCLEIDRFDFAIIAEIKDDHAILCRCDVA